MKFMTIEKRLLSVERIILNGKKYFRRGHLLNTPEWSEVSIHTEIEYGVGQEVKYVLENLYQELKKESE